MKVLQLPRWMLSLFDGDDTAGDANDGDNGASADQHQDGNGRDSRNDRRDTSDRTRNDRGQFQTQSEERIYNALEKQRGETRAAQREAKQAKEQLAELAPKAALADVMAQRALRSDARDALRDAGVLHPDVVDLFLAKSPEVKLDDKTGESVGITEALTRFKSSHAALFKVEASKDDKADDKGDKADDGKKADDSKADDDGKKNATSKGASPAGNSGGDSSNSGGIPDLRGLTPQQRKAAMTAYKQSLNVR